MDVVSADRERQRKMNSRVESWLEKKRNLFKKNMLKTGDFGQSNWAKKACQSTEANDSGIVQAMFMGAGKSDHNSDIILILSLFIHLLCPPNMKISLIFFRERSYSLAPFHFALRYFKNHDRNYRHSNSDAANPFSDFMWWLKTTTLNFTLEISPLFCYWNWETWYCLPVSDSTGFEWIKHAPSFCRAARSQE